MRRTTEARLATITKSTGAGFWEWNIDSGELNIDERWASMLGYALSELTPFTFTKWEELLHPDDRPANLESITRALESRSDDYDCTVRLKHKDGGWRWIHTRGVMFEDPDSGDQWFLGSHIDVTEYQETQHQLSVLAESLPGIIYTFVQAPDGAQYFPYMSRKTEDFYGFPPEQAVRQPELIFGAVHPDDLEHVMDTIKQSYESLEQWHCDYRVRGKDGFRWMRGISTPERDSDGTVTWHGMVINIDEQKRLEINLKRLSITDDITCAFNRRYILQEMESQLAEHERYGKPLSLVSVDIDHFDQINVEHGHLAADGILKSVAEIIFKRIRKTDMFARLGADQFLVLMPYTVTESARNVADALKEAVENQAFRLAGEQELKVTVSLGVVDSINGELTSVESILSACDQSLRLAKSQGGNCMVVFERE